MIAFLAFFWFSIEGFTTLEYRAVGFSMLAISFLFLVRVAMVFRHDWRQLTGRGADEDD
jgi:hypothetical protein